MKKIVIPLLVAVLAAVPVSFVRFEAREANAASDLPTTINLNDCSESQIREYYSGLNSLSESERQGANLLKNLKPILKNGHTPYFYDESASTQVWQAYEIIDRDWVKSPAGSDTFGEYDEDTETITGYKYGTSATNSRNNPYIHALYVNRELDNQTTAWDDHGQTAWGINREHIWAKSHGFDTLVDDHDTGGARGDPMHLWAGNGWANHDHLNYFFAFVDKSQKYKDCGDKYNTIYDNLTGVSLNAGGKETVFEPQDCDKGDIARAVFYMVARYNNYANATEGIDANEPNLVLKNDLSENTTTGTSTFDVPYAMGLLSDLLAWNKLDPVDEFEIHRNNLLFNNYTKNRNPFIDFPEWADYIWGTADLDGSNYNSNVTGKATPSSDAIAAPVSMFELSTPRVRLEPGNTDEIFGKNTEGAITWSIDDESVATINKTSTVGSERVTVTAVAAGKATITATCGGKTVKGTIIVKEPEPINYGTQEEPLTITEAKTLIDDNSPTLEKMYVKGVVSSSAYNQELDNYDIWLESEDSSEPNAFKLYHATLDAGVTSSLVGKEVVAYGFGQKDESTYELAPQMNADEPVILSAKNPGDKTPKELVQEKVTSTSLSYRYTRDDAAAITGTDTITKAETGSPSSYKDWTYNDENSNITYSGNSSGTYSSVQLRTTNKNSGIVIASNPGEKKIDKVTVNWNSNTPDGRTLNIYGKDSAYTAATDLYDNDLCSTLLGTIVKGATTSFAITGDYEYIGFRSKSDTLYITSIDIEWNGIGVVYEYTDVSIRFGGSLTQDLWNELDTDSHIIEGFGVMIATDDVIGKDTEIKDLYGSAASAASNPDVSEEIVDYFVPIEDMNAKIGVDGSNYFWNLRYSITNFKTLYVAAAYIKTSSGYVFFKQTQYSAKDLAQDYLDNRNCDNNTAGGSLANLAKI